MKMVKVLQEEMNKWLKEIKKRTWKNGIKQYIPLACYESQGKTNEVLKETSNTVQDLETEVEAIKRTQNAGILKIKNLDKQTRTTDVNITNSM